MSRLVEAFLDPALIHGASLEVAEREARLEFEMASADGKNLVLPKAIVCPSEWDSAQLERKVARIRVSPDLDVNDARTVADACQIDGYEMGVCRLNSNFLTAIQSLETAGFVQVDSLLTVGAPTPHAAPHDCVPCEKKHEESIVEIACEAFLFSRYGCDPLITVEQTKSVYESWVRNSFSGSIASAVGVATNPKGDVLGFVTTIVRTFREHALRVASIGLIAIRPEAKGQGVGTRLMNAFFESATSQGCAYVTVGAHTGNMAALRLYVRMGLRPISADTTLRWAPMVNL